MAAKKKTTKKKTQTEQSLVSDSLKNRIIALILLFFVIIAFMKLGVIGNALNTACMFLFGNMLLMGIYVLIGLLFVYTLAMGKWPHPVGPEAIGFYLMIFSGLAICCYAKADKGVGLISQYISKGVYGKGGFVGYLCYGLTSALFDSMGALIFAIVVLCIGICLFLSKTYLKYKKTPEEKAQEKEEKEQKMAEKNEEPTGPVVNKVVVRQKGPKFFDFLHDEKELPLFPDEVFDDKNNKKDKYYGDDVTSAFEFNDKSMRLDIKDKKPAKKLEPVEPPKPVKTRNGEYQLPSYKLLNPLKKAKNSNDEARNAQHTAQVLEQLLQQFGVNAHVQDLHIGPTVTKYELKLEVGTRVNKILQLQDDIQLALAAKEIRIEAPIPGKPFVGIEVPNKAASMVPYNEIFQMSMHDTTWENKLAVPLGKDVSGNLIVAELNKMPHLLIAGATGSGKSVCVNSIITSLLMKSTPDEVRLILVDPKKVELSNYNGVPHLLAPVVTDPKKAAGVLQEVVVEMERRYEVFATHNQRNITSYNNFAKKHNLDADPEDQYEVMPYHVIILDEVADLMMVASKTVEDCIMRISQMARAAGIHMIVATQRPSTDIITGVIKANIPSRIAFAVSSSIDSRTILDSSGAEKLLGKGDMLFSPMGATSPVRVQGAFVDDNEVARVVKFVSEQMEANYEDKFVNAKELSNSGSSSSSDDYEETDEEYEECREFVIQAQKASTSLLQRKFRIGYNKAARIIDQLEENGVIGPQDGSKPREVYIRKYEEEDL